MRLTSILNQARVGLMALALTVATVTAALAADLTSGLTAGTVNTISALSNDEFTVVQATKLNATTTSATFNIPANTLNTPRIYLFGTNTGAGGISPSITQAPLKLDGVTLDGDTTATVYTDTVSTTNVLADVTTAAQIISATLDTSTRQLRVVAANVSTSEVLDVRVEYRIPAKYRWYRAYK